VAATIESVKESRNDSLGVFLGVLTPAS